MNKKILCIEDEAVIQKTLADTFEKSGYQAVSALDGAAGLRLAKETKPDLILLDLILPKMDGFEVLRHLKDDAQTKAIPVIVLTNLEQMQDIQRVLDLGATTYLVKANYNLEELVEMVQKALES
ncbi:MAG: hypothetical protein A3E07_01625 [Candidatus Wildermuthbacteria bacterium RIFCSPHIGHO2_12_FULL_45_9]|uniref:Response regulatory domain-containing protein n=1 Tax=Candidatus Wildermuthbacteria bacterium RIFCSPHIGHO2_02_FULL_45_25 TaxID=1802450 RepID=A0A1G2R0T5_9BACT|nr:MAG: hypothetical protein A2748_02945 [Candidatus Wildermuthbacteria bacterium RIFCSPHIGHO2_01_FULL_45_20]OHA66494.1 MAG: hypothetical protein A3C04_04120 [Candidatus Wildermuthbacteria bacterium RIFCSPHIGHO2_02_FULL_45_25]OHA71147.1 MAG: hypothetical protein A3E07_01625 [Candidatus Wildermuthbacteria bacterium RIFCSPHIGHO2_12_FULL_45_9]